MEASNSTTMGDCEQEIDNIAIRCFLCRGYVLYKDGDLERFKAHLANQHGAFFDIDYLIASCFMEDSQKLAVSKPIMESLNSEIPVKQETVENSDKTKIKKEKTSKAKTPKDKSTKVKKEKPLKVKKEKSSKVKKPKAAKDVEPSEVEVSDEKASAEEPYDSSVMSVSDADASFSSAADSLLEELNNELNSLDSSMDVTIEDTETSTLDEENTEDQPQLESKKKGKKKIEKGSNSAGDSRWEALCEVLAKQGIDITKSAYFSKTKQVLSSGEKFQEKFTDTVPCLPENWKFRTVDAKDKGKVGITNILYIIMVIFFLFLKVVVHKHFLSPEGAMMKTTMAVVEYLRIEGKLKPDEILEVAKNLKVGSRKLQKLFSNDMTGLADAESEATGVTF